MNFIPMIRLIPLRSHLKQIMMLLETIKQKPKVKLEKLILTHKQAVILTKRPTVTAGVLHELLQIGEKPFWHNKRDCIKYHSGRIFNIKREASTNKRA